MRKRKAWWRAGNGENCVWWRRRKRKRLGCILFATKKIYMRREYSHTIICRCYVYYYECVVANWDRVRIGERSVLNWQTIFECVVANWDRVRIGERSFLELTDNFWMCGCELRPRQDWRTIVILTDDFLHRQHNVCRHYLMWSPLCLSTVTFFAASVKSKNNIDACPLF